MKYAIIEVNNGNYFIKAEGIATPDAAKVRYHDRCRVLWNSPDVKTAMVMIADENLDAVEGYKEFIRHEQEEQE